MPASCTEIAETTLPARLREAIRAELIPLIGRQPRRIMLVDPPDHTNAGDSLILVGELDFLRREFPASRLSFVDWRSYTARSHKEVNGTDIVLIHGGGNFGDLYRHHHDLRMSILEDHRDNRVIQLPQTIHFDDPAEVERTARIIASHPDFTLLLRDAESLAFAQKHFDCNARLVPDMAFAANPMQRAGAQVELLALLRTDKESVSQRADVIRTIALSGRSHRVEDWLRETNFLIPRSDRKFTGMIRRYPRLARFPGLLLREARARQRIHFATRLLSCGERVVTDRLHGHIFCELLGIEHFAFDSYGGKISKFCATWSKTSSLLTPVQDAQELAGLLR